MWGKSLVSFQSSCGIILLMCWKIPGKKYKEPLNWGKNVSHVQQKSIPVSLKNGLSAVRESSTLYWLWVPVHFAVLYLRVSVSCLCGPRIYDTSGIFRYMAPWPLRLSLEFWVTICRCSMQESNLFSDFFIWTVRVCVWATLLCELLSAQIMHVTFSVQRK